MKKQILSLAGRATVAEIEVHGRGAPLLYLHGAFGLKWSEPLIAELASRRTVIAPHLPGYGGSDGLEQIRSFYDLSVWLDEVLDALGEDRIELMGHDFGGAAAAEYAALYRRRVSALTLIAPYGIWPEGEPLADIFGLTPGALTKLLFADPMGQAAQDFNRQYTDKAQQDEAILARRQAMIAAAKLLWPIPDKGLKRRLYRIGAPTVVVGGRHDRMMDAAYIERFASLIQGAQAHMVDAGHMVPQEAPSEVAVLLAGSVAAAAA
jgi:pimeloyl-ACP methyl ester carboxylesterase